MVAHLSGFSFSQKESRSAYLEGASGSHVILTINPYSGLIDLLDSATVMSNSTISPPNGYVLLTEHCDLQFDVGVKDIAGVKHFV